MERKKLFVRIGIGAAGVLLLVAVFAGVSMVGERNHLRHGMEEGFELRGPYQLRRPDQGERAAAGERCEGEAGIR